MNFTKAIFGAAVCALLFFGGAAHAQLYWKCQAANSNRNFPIVSATRQPGDQNIYWATMRTLGLSREEATALGMRCQQVMGANDPRPKTPELAKQEYERKYANCLPPPSVSKVPFGEVIFRLENQCTWRATGDDLRFVIGVMGYGIGCGYGKNNPDLVLLYTGAFTKMTMGYPDMSEAGLRPATVLGDHYAKALGCGGKMQQMTDTAAAILRN